MFLAIKRAQIACVNLALKNMVCPAGVEPATYSVGAAKKVGCMNFYAKYRVYLAYFLHILCINSVIFTLCNNFYSVWV